MSKRFLGMPLPKEFSTSNRQLNNLPIAERYKRFEGDIAFALIGRIKRSIVDGVTQLTPGEKALLAIGVFIVAGCALTQVCGLSVQAFQNSRGQEQGTGTVTPDPCKQPPDSHTFCIPSSSSTQTPGERIRDFLIAPFVRVETDQK